jgi:hypothetical protein
MDSIYIYNIVVTHTIELIAAIAGSIYLKKTQDQSVRLFVIYLWILFTAEVICLYPYFFYYNDFDYSWFQWIKNSSFYSNAWLYAILSFIAVILIGLYYWRLVKTTLYKSIIRNLIILYCVIATLYTLFKDKIELLEKLNFFAEEIVVLSCVVLYLFELFKSEKILKFYHSCHFYIAFALLIWYICVMPIFLFDEFFTELNTFYRNFRILTILAFNVISFLCITYGFYYALRNRKTLVKNRSL